MTHIIQYPAVSSIGIEQKNDVAYSDWPLDAARLSLWRNLSCRLLVRTPRRKPQVRKPQAVCPLFWFAQPQYNAEQDFVPCRSALTAASDPTLLALATPATFPILGKEMDTNGKAEEREWQAHELEPNPHPLKRRFVFWYTRRTKVHPPPPFPALEETLDVPPPKLQDVLYCLKVYGPLKRRKVSAIRQFPPGCGPMLGAATNI
ncbi:hypothetical protein M5K25_015113 [Dendrobium thyrsiflorum]|uniref:Uncharacterized protein n=1 Tax=Dendrobium thyrsiflorum TaxID=117978 RepID=A0ABD0UWG5_DENTH